MEVS
ncbi:hypothetical protein QN277_003964 [Acacia crassicarpa]|jgi:hypothetical protein